MSNRYRFHALIGLTACALSYAIALPARAFAFVLEIFAPIFDARPFQFLFAGVMPVLAAADGTPIEAALFQRNRHEAGLARLGAVRHR
jgi:hypothetical protein